ncbi:hypothetical protein [Streptacidiphilus fuscans]|uniref:Uncharacterized protein n=1 Tax=Streptacidiphilus fuscans TaxID=2789292 RepID=A0A931BE45_9ACTN|nr:hypothetical protein [Streptacidiphilus fuscans]MBF9071775.1 hypothetical protein [Streptacidiphilus fuscans]
MTPVPAPNPSAPQSPGRGDDVDVAFARDRSLGLVAATSDDSDTGLAATVLRHFGFALDPDKGIWRLPARMLWVDQVLAAAQASTLLSGLGHTVVADEETRTTALALAAQQPPPTSIVGATLVQLPAHRTPAPSASAPQRR